MVAEVFKVACIQNCAEDDMTANIHQCQEFVRQSAAEGAELICLPEYFAHMDVSDIRMQEIAYDESQHPAIPAFSELANELNVWILMGSLAIKRLDGLLNNRSFLINNHGQCVSRYDKIHLFDVMLNGVEESYTESATVAPGTKIAISRTPWGNLGLSICYDVRFPYLYRSLAQQGSDFIAVPAAFTQTTGEKHWHTLICCRAIETGSYIFAPNQCGVRHWGRATFGHSMIVNPQGEILADAGGEPGYIVAEVDPQLVVESRSAIPSLQHDRFFQQDSEYTE